MIDGVAYVFSQTEDEFVYWPSREEPMNCAAFTVTLINTDRLCLCNEEQIIIHNFILEATQVLHFLCFICVAFPTVDIVIKQLHISLNNYGYFLDLSLYGSI